VATIGAERAVRLAGLALGLVVAGLLVAGWRLPPGAGTLGADVGISLVPTGELALAPSGHILSAAGLVPGPETSARRGAVTVRNQTGSTLDVSLRALPSTGALDDLLHVAVVAGVTRLYAGPLHGLRNWSRRGFTVRRGERTRLAMAVWIPGGAGDDYRGRTEDLTVELRPTPRKSA
jgi:hypothetical protein